MTELSGIRNKTLYEILNIYLEKRFNEAMLEQSPQLLDGKPQRDVK